MLKKRLKKVLPVSWQARLRRLSRLRWLTKLEVLGYSGIRLRDVRWHHVAYLLWSPEVESHTYDVANVDEMASFIAELLKVDLTEVRRHLDQARDDLEFTDRWRRHTAWRWDVKRRLMLGNRLLWWGVVRALKPTLCVECGIYQGVGSLVLLRALEVNSSEGHEGTLMSIDSDETMGWAVPPRLTPRWTKVNATTTDALPEVIEGLEVSVLIHDTVHTYENAFHEFNSALDNAANVLVLIDCSGGRTTALKDVCRTHGGVYGHFQDRARNHFQVGSGTAIGVFRR